MKVEMKNVGTCRVKLVIKAEPAEIHKDYESVTQRYLREARVRGFRLGKAPRAVIEREYHQEINRDIRQQLVSVFSRRAVEEQKLALVSMVDVGDILFSSETGISFVLTCDVAPEFKLPKYQKIPLKITEPAVDDAAVENQVAQLRQRMATYEDGVADVAVVQGDVVRIDFTAVSDGKPLKEVTEEAAMFSEGTGFWMQVSEPEMIPGVSLAVAGMKIDEEKVIKTKFPKDFKLEALQGVKATYTIKVAGFRHQIPATDEEMCQQLKSDDIDAVRTMLREQMQQQAEVAEKRRREQEVIDFLLKKTEFDLPESEVAEETGHTVRTMVNTMMSRGGSTREDLEKTRDELLATATTTAKDRLRLRYILARIAEDAKVEVADSDVDGKIKEFAVQQQTTPEKMRETIETRYGIEGLRADVRAEKTLEFLINSAKG